MADTDRAAEDIRRFMEGIRTEPLREWVRSKLVPAGAAQGVPHALLDPDSPDGVSPIWRDLVERLDRNRMSESRLAGLEPSDVWNARMAGERRAARRSAETPVRKAQVTVAAPVPPDDAPAAGEAGGVSWTREESRWVTDFEVRGHGFSVHFDDVGDDEWSLDWNTVGEVPQGTGMFPDVNTRLKTIVTDFIHEKNPAVVHVSGSDPKRNAWYAANWGEWTPDGYEFVVETDHDSDKASAEGVSVVSFKAIAPVPKPR